MERKDLYSFNFRGSTIRIIMMYGDPWFAVEDVCKILGYKSLKSILDDYANEQDENVINCVSYEGGKLDIISECGFYPLTFCSEKNEAEEFRRWITDVIMPQVQINPPPDCKYCANRMICGES